MSFSKVLSAAAITALLGVAGVQAACPALSVMVGSYQVCYTYRSNYLSMYTTVTPQATNGWIALGFSPNQKMAGTSVLVASAGKAPGAAYDLVAIGNPGSDVAFTTLTAFNATIVSAGSGMYTFGYVLPLVNYAYNAPAGSQAHPSELLVSASGVASLIVGLGPAYTSAGSFMQHGTDPSTNSVTFVDSSLTPGTSSGSPSPSASSSSTSTPAPSGNTGTTGAAAAFGASVASGVVAAVAAVFAMRR